MAARSASDIWAVGSLLPNANATRVKTLALHYNGATWSHVATPDVGSEANSFYGVAALPDGTAWATGIYTPGSGHTGRALTEHWNGHHWSVVPAAEPGASDDMLYGVAGVSDADVWAVGGYSGPDGFFHPLVEHWNGHRWAVTSVTGLRGDHGMLTSVTASPGGGVWATGQLVNHAPDQQVVLHLESGSWVVARGVVRTPAGAVASGYPQSVGASPLGPWVAGNDRAGQAGFSTLVEALGSGGHLAQLRTPNPTRHDNYLSGIAPDNGGHNAWAVGYSLAVTTGNASSLIEYGSAAGGWKTVPSPDPGAVNSGNTFINGVLALAGNNAWAVGDLRRGDRPAHADPALHRRPHLSGCARRGGRRRALVASASHRGDISRSVLIEEGRPGYRPARRGPVPPNAIASNSIAWHLIDQGRVCETCPCCTRVRRSDGNAGRRRR